MTGIRKTFVRGGEKLDVHVGHEGGDAYRAAVGGASIELRAQPLPDGGVRIRQGDASHVAYVVARGPRLQVRLDGQTYDLQSAGGRGPATGGAGNGVIEAPMTGTVLEVRVALGDVVAADQAVVVLNAMKMEHRLTAGVAGTVKELACRPGQAVEAGSVLARIEPEAVA
jgi:biotin carboxyl carrier protein